MSALKNIRTAARITQQQLAAKLGITQAAIGHYEKGRRQPKLTEARRLVAALNELGAACTLEEVFPPEAEEDAQAA
ncbi:putative transcriptional regulator [Azotobacter beijerinckii]|uniref:Putative transcriptional regulator n=1 Tax=Azotobacter beijerinckii TaxID=170623 RepID=A0A1H7AEY9_9GAMM|nr:helix-turn-helix transcriptional regulator [Azotobacter beijerinckii]SEJ63506.1 putative transcriptional regulator [Azotobacter beijerinckii]